MCKPYNGYVNYQTWVVSLWLDNDYVSYIYYTERAQELLDEHGDKCKACSELAAEIERHHENHNPLLEDASVYTDLMGHALGAINWQAVAQSFFED